MTSGADLFYKMGAQAGDTLDVSVSGTWYPVAYLVNSCDSSATSCLASTPSLEIADHQTGSFEYIFASGGTYMLAVDGLNGECGDFTLTTRLHGATTGILPDDGHGGQLTLSSRPNPTRGEVSFTGGVPAQASQVHLTIHDAAGRLVSRLESPASLGWTRSQWG